MARGELTAGDEDGGESSHVDAALAAFGLVLEGSVPQAPAFHLLPDNVEVFNLFNQVQTQWRHGMAGPTGLDYAGVRASPAFRSIASKEREPTFEAVCIMERAWLDAAAEVRAENDRKSGHKA